MFERDWLDLTTGSDPRADVMAAVVPLTAPSRVWISRDGTSVQWSTASEGESMAAITAEDTGALKSFARLHRLDHPERAEAIRSLVATYGPLGLCSHGKPAGHLPARVAHEVRDLLDREQSRLRRCEHDARAAAAEGKRRPRRPRPSTDEDAPWWTWAPCSTTTLWAPGGRARGVGGSERLADWAVLSAQAEALIAVGASTRRYREAMVKVTDCGASVGVRDLGLPELTDLEPLGALLSVDLDLVVPWTDITDPDGRRRLIGSHGAGWPKVGLRPTDPKSATTYDEEVRVADKDRILRTFDWAPSALAAVAHDLQRVTQVAVQTWVDWGDLRVRLLVDDDTGMVRVRYGNGSLFSALALQLALSIGGMHALAVCDQCRTAHRPTTWPTSGNHLFCDECRNSPHYDSIRKWFSRHHRPWPGPSGDRRSKDA